MTDTAGRLPPTDPYVTGQELAAHIGGAVPAGAADQCAFAATMALWSILADPGWGTDAPAGVRQATLMVGAEVFRAGQAPGGEYQLDAWQQTPAVVTSNLTRKYRALLAPWLLVTGMVG